MTSESAADAQAALIIQMAEHAERITGISAQEASHFADVSARLCELDAKLTSVGARVEKLGVVVAGQGAVVDALDGLDGQVAILARQLTKLATADGEKGDSYQPLPPPRWWKLDEQDRNAAVGRLRAWVEHIYRPGYGQLAATLPACWESHPLCLYLLDWLSELWSVLYLSPQRTSTILAAQAEWQTRLLPAAAEQMAFDASRCGHAGRRRQPSPSDSGAPGA